MKVVIELFGNESVNELLSASNFLRDLAGEGGRKIVDTPEQTETDKTDLDKLADAVVEATKAKGEELCLPLLMEAERSKTRARRSAKLAPAEEPAPIEEPAPAEEPAPIEEPEKVKEPAPAPKTPAAPVEKSAKTETEHTIDECKQWAMKALNAKKRPLVQEAFEQVGATSFPTLKESMFAEFIEYISTRL